MNSISCHDPPGRLHPVSQTVAATAQDDASRMFLDLLVNETQMMSGFETCFSEGFKYPLVNIQKAMENHNF